MAKTYTHKKYIMAKPFVKWAGGKGNLLNVLESQLPDDFELQEEVTYVEPFVGGGAMLFHMLNNHDNIKRVIINDINTDLIKCYMLIKDDPELLIKYLEKLNNDFYDKNDELKKVFFYKIRDEFNANKLGDAERAAYLVFLNHTCFNGLYRENASGGFNVPYGRNKKPKICDTDVIIADHEVLSKVDIICGDYKNIINYLNNDYTFIYLDPPYRPLNGSDNFKQYSKSGFGDPEQEELKVFCDNLTEHNYRFMLSNSDSTNEDGTSYFETLYNDYYYDKILATRFINAYANKREKQREILIKNYDNPKVVLPLILE